MMESVVPERRTTTEQVSPAYDASLDDRLRMALEVQHLWVERGHKIVLADVSFTANAGELTGIVGPNGAGKTTLLRTLAGERPSSGHVLLGGEELFEDPEYWLTRIGYVPADNVLHEHLTVEQALRFLGRLRMPGAALPAIERKLDSVLTSFGFPAGDPRRSRLVGNLSTGERKKANICAELLGTPPLLLLDEPTSNLDPDAERDLMQALRDFAHHSGQTVLVVTHTLNTIDRCDKVLFFENAILRAKGSPSTVLENLESELGALIGDAGEAEPGRYDISRSDFYRWARVFHPLQTEDARRAERVAERRSLLVLDEQSVENTPAQRHPLKLGVRSQVIVLLRRYLRVRLNEPRVLCATLLLGTIGGLCLFVLPQDAFLRPGNPGDYSTREVS